MRRARELARKVSQESGRSRLRALRSRVESLEEAVAENVELDRGLDRQLGDLEARLHELAAAARRVAGR